MSELLTRDQFRTSVFARDRGRCVFCPAPAVDAHHIVERRLFPDGGYYLDNGISVCERHHRACERTDISLTEARAAALITNTVLPPGLLLEKEYDKWGNEILSNGQRVPGPLFEQVSVQQAVSEYLHVFVNDNSQMLEIVKYPRTAHISGSKLQGDDTTDGQVHVRELPEGEHVWEEKIDGANGGFSFNDDLDFVRQSRGHALLGGPRERQWDLFKAWSATNQEMFFDRFENRYRIYGEWTLAKHTVFYDLLPHYFMEFDIFDRKRDIWLDTPSRHALCEGLPFCHVPVVHRGRLNTTKEVRALIRPSLYKSSDWKANLIAAAAKVGVGEEQVLRETNMSDLSEGLYLKIERDGAVIGRYKFVRSDFLQSILDSGSHWADRTIVPNRLAPGVVI